MKAVIAAVLSFFVPGLGDAFVGRYRAAAAWLAAMMAVVVVAALVSVWIAPMLIAIQLASVIGAFRQARTVERVGEWPGWVIAVLGVVFTLLAYYGSARVIRRVVAETDTLPSTSMAPTFIIGDHVFIDKISPRLHGIARGDVIAFHHPCSPEIDYLKRVIALAGETVEVRCNVVYVDGKPLTASLVQGAGCRYDDERSGEWSERLCSEYAETAGTRAYHVYHDADRPSRDAKPEDRHGDAHDFPRLDGSAAPPSCQRAHEEEGGPSGATDQLPGTVVETKADAGPCEPQRHYVVPAGHVFVLGDNRSNSNDSRYWGSVPLDNLKGRASGIWMTEGRSGPSIARFGSAK